MRRRLWIVLGGAVIGLAALAAGAGMATASVQTRITVRPASGSPSSSFVVRFRAPLATGALRGVRREFVLSLSGRTGAAGCVSEGSIDVPATRAHANVRVTLTPRRFGGSRWCPGAFSGEITLIEAPRCPPRDVCPALVLLVGTVGTFRFHVAAPSRDTTPPHFAGLERATACTPGPQRPRQTTQATLTWSAASDDRTPPSQIVYDIFMAATPGAENFLAPTWTTAPGVTSFQTPGLPSHGIAYFVVRARDQAGNEDGNIAERRLIDPCL